MPLFFYFYTIITIRMVLKINKKIFIFFIALIVYTVNNSVALCMQPFESKLVSLEKDFSSQNSKNKIRTYENTLILRAKYYSAKKDYQNASIDLMSALYFMKEDTGRYQKFNNRLNKTFKLGGFEPNEINKLDLAKTLYFEKKYYASFWLFKNVLVDEYQKEACYEYLGNISQIQNKPQEASAYYLKSLEIYSTPTLKLKLAQTYDELSKTELATEQYRQILEITDDKAITAEIIEIFNKKTQTEPNNANNFEILGTAYAKNKKFDKTYVLYKQALEIKPNDVFLKYLLAGLLHELQENERAIEMYNSILDDDIYESQIRIGKAKCLEKLGRQSEAIKEYQTVLIFYPKSYAAGWGIYKLLNGKYSPETIFANFYPLDNKFVLTSSFLVNFGDFLAESGHTNDAGKIYNLALTYNSKNKTAYTHLYNFYELTGQNNLANNTIKKASTLFPNDSDVLKLYTQANKDNVSKKNSIAKNYIKNKEYNRAIETYLQIVPLSADVYFSIADCYKSMKNYPKTLEYYKKGLNIEPKSVEGNYALAMVYFEKNDLDNARIHLNKALEVDKKNIGAKRLLATITNKQVEDILNNAYDYFNKKDYKKVNEILTSGIKKYPKDPQLYYYRALNFEAQKDYKNATVDLKNAINADKNFELAYFNLATILEATGKEKEALEAYERFLGGNSNNIELIQKAQGRVEELTKKYY